MIGSERGVYIERRGGAGRDTGFKLLTCIDLSRAQIRWVLNASVD